MRFTGTGAFSHTTGLLNILQNREVVKMRFEINNGFVLGNIPAMERMEAVKIACKPYKFRTETEQSRLEYLADKNHKIGRD